MPIRLHDMHGQSAGLFGRWCMHRVLERWVAVHAHSAGAQAQPMCAQGALAQFDQLRMVELQALNGLLRCGVSGCRADPSVAVKDQAFFAGGRVGRDKIGVQVNGCSAFDWGTIALMDISTICRGASQHVGVGQCQFSLLALRHYVLDMAVADVGDSSLRVRTEVSLPLKQGGFDVVFDLTGQVVITQVLGR